MSQEEFYLTCRTTILTADNLGFKIDLKFEIMDVLFR